MNPQPYIIVLAGNTREGRRYAKLAGLPRGRHRVVFSAKQIRHLRSAEIHELPSFSRRLDRHGINAALRYTRGERKLVEMPDEDVAVRRHVQMSSYGDIPPRRLEAAYRYNALRDDAEHAAWLKLETPTSTQIATGLAKVEDQGDGMGPQTTIDGFDEQVTIPAPRKRRSRCRLCGELVFGDDDPDHDTAAHEAQDAKLLGKPAPTPSNFFGASD